MARKKTNPKEANSEGHGEQKVIDALVRAEETMSYGFQSSSEKLMGLLNDMSELTRKRSVLEMEISRVASLNKNFDSEAQAMQSSLDELFGLNKTLIARRDELADAHKALSKENQALEKSISKMEHDVARLENDAAEGKKTTADLEKKKTRLAEDVDRLAAIKAEYMERIAKFKAMREELTK